MKRYQVTGRHIPLHSGTVELTRAQAEPRLGQLGGHTLAKAHVKASAKSDLRAAYTVVGEVHFKVGEILGYDGDVPKAWGDVLIDLDAAEAAAMKAAEEEAARAEARERNDRESRELDQLLAAMQGITGDENFDITIDELQTQLAGRVNFVPTEHQLHNAWAVHVERLAS